MVIWVHVRDLTGNEFPLQATTVNEYELNGNMSITATIYPSKVNQAFIRDITEMWTLVDHDGVEHKIIYVKRKGEGASLYVEVKGIPLFFDVLDTLRIYEEYNEHMTAQLAFSRIFEDTGFDFILADSFPAVQWEGFGGGESRLETFKRALERYGAEFRIQGNIVYLHKQIGRDTQFQYRHRLNASNIIQEIDASELWTFARGYGDYEDGGEDGGGGGWQEAKLIREYTSPIAQIIGIRHAPPIKDGRIKDEQTMDEALKRLVDESLKISVSADIHDLRRQGYPLAQPELGDRVYLIDERIGLNQEVRVVEMTLTRNWKGEVIDLRLTFGSHGLGKRHQSNLQTAVKEITDIVTGRRKLPFSVLDQAVINATNALKRITSQLVIPENGGLMAVDRDNPNNVVLFNAAGIGISNDGGATFRTAMTGDGIVADVITAGVIDTNLVMVRGGSPNDYILMDGSYFESNAGDRRIEIRGGNVYSYAGGDLAVRFGQFKLDFYHRDGSPIGSFGPTNIIDNPDRQGLALDVLGDYITIGHWVGDRRRPVFRTQKFDGYETIVTGPYEAGTGVQTVLTMGANSRIALPESGDNVGSRTNQPTIRLIHRNDGANSLNNVLLYFGGLGDYNNSYFEIRRNTGLTTSEQIAVFRQDYIRLNRERIYFSDTSAHIEEINDYLNIWSSGDVLSGIRLWHGGQLDVYSEGDPVISLLKTSSGDGAAIRIRDNAYLYYGGPMNYGASLEIRRNTGSSSSELVAAFRPDYIRLNKTRIYFSNTSAHIEEIGDSLTIWSSEEAMSGVRIWHSGQVDFISGGQSIHQFYTSGSKLGGSIEIDGERYGMFPTDSPQSLIEYVEFDVEVDGLTEVVLDEKYLKAVENFSVWTNNPEIQVVEKTANSVILTGQGKTDILIKGLRRDMSDVMWGIMGRVEKEQMSV